MSLLQLLAVGKSLVSGRKEIGRFKMNPEGQLPTFGERSGGTSTGVRGDSVGTGASGPARLFRFLAAWRRKPGRPSVGSTKGSWTGTAANKVPDRDDRDGGAKMIQQELALEKIRVQRNDLTDADVEVVARRRATMERSVIPPKPPVERSVPASGFVWNKMTAKLFAANRARVE